MKYKVLNIVVLFGTIIFLLSYMFFVDGFDNIREVFQSANLLWLAAGVLCMLIYWLLESATLHSSLKCFPNNISFRQSFKTSMIGQLFNCLTPSASGGQPMQAYYMNRLGLSAGYSTSSLLVRFIVYQVGLALYCLVMLLFRYKAFMTEVRNFRFLILFGFAVTTTVAVGLLLIGFKKNLACKLMRGIIKILAKLHIIKKPEKMLEKVDVETERFHDGFRIMRKHKARLLYMFILTIIQLTAFFCVPVTIAFGFGVENVKIFTMIAASAFVLMASSFVPLPGSAGGAELSFFVVFGMFFSSGQLSSAVLFWRLFTFYMPIVCGYPFARNLFGKKLSIKKPDEAK